MMVNRNFRPLVYVVDKNDKKGKRSVVQGEVENILVARDYALYSTFTDKGN